MDWGPGYTQTELDDAQARYALTFPPDLADLLRDRRPFHGYDWTREDKRIRKMLAWPTDCLLFDVEHGFWWPEWGTRPETAALREERVRAHLSGVPRLIPILSHRFIPETPHVAGNPIFSMHGFDTIYYGSCLDEYFSNEINGTHHIGVVRTIPFWSDLVNGFDKAHAYYAASTTGKQAVERVQDALSRKTT